MIRNFLQVYEAKHHQKTSPTLMLLALPCSPPHHYQHENSLTKKNNLNNHVQSQVAPWTMQPLGLVASFKIAHQYSCLEKLDNCLFSKNQQNKWLVINICQIIKFLLVNNNPSLTAVKRGFKLEKIKRKSSYNILLPQFK